MMLSAAIQYIYPAIDFRKDCILQDDGDGVYVREWNRPEPQPTQEQIDAVMPAAMVVHDRSLIQPVTRRQMFTALHRLGLLDAIKQAVSASEDFELQIAFAESLDFARDNALLIGVARAIGKTDEELDAVFKLAASI